MSQLPKQLVEIASILAYGPSVEKVKLEQALKILGRSSSQCMSCHSGEIQNITVIYRYSCGCEIEYDE